MPECPPVLFIVFKRPTTTRMVRDAIREARPSRLYIAADGPRPDHPGEVGACANARSVALEVDWPCKVHSLLREQNLGCRLGVSSAIDWFFKNESEGIILEDDVVPTRSFFPFCAELLAHYRDDSRVSMIGGTNFQRGARVGDATYYFSRMHHIWGWATWRRAWKKYDLKMDLWGQFKNDGGFRRHGLESHFASHFAPIFEAVSKGRIDTWDHQWTFSALVNNMLAIIPQVNLVSNVGFGADATHTSDARSPMSNLATGELEFPIIHPDYCLPKFDADLRTIMQERRTLRARVVGYLRRRFASLTWLWNWCG